MRKNLSLAALPALLTAFLGVGLVTAGPADAASGGSWRAYGNTNPITSSSSTWTCGATTAPFSGIKAQVCAVRSASGSGVQGAVIVRNNRSSLFRAGADVTVHKSSGTSLGTWVCSSSGVAANSWSVCFGSTFTYTGGVYASGHLTGA